jgi:hypothetical protein
MPVATTNLPGRLDKNMKTSSRKNLSLACLGLAVGALLSSCVDPYYAGQGGPSSRVVEYRQNREIRRLPSGYRTEVIDGNNYYNHNGTYYRRQSGGYVVVEAPRPRYGSSQDYRETSITRLPRGYREVTHRGNRYYQVNDVYYQRRGSVYVTVTRPY